MIDYNKIDAMVEGYNPDGGKCGLLLPKPGWKPGDVSPLFSPDWELTDAELDQDESDGLIPFCWHIFHQQYNSCAAESGLTVLHTTRRLAGLDDVIFNPLFVYHYVCGGRDGGAQLSDVLATLRDKGCAPESVWPYSNGWQRKPSQEAVKAAEPYRLGEFYEIRSTRQFRSALRLKWAVACGSKGHAVSAMKDRKTYPVIANTWGRSWGQDGFGKWDGSYESLWQTYRAFAYRTSKTVT